MKKSIIVSALFSLSLLITGFTILDESKDKKGIVVNPVKDTLSVAPIDTISVAEEVKLTHYKKDVLTTYYADKFNGRKTSSGERFNNQKYTAAHMKLPFGTKLRVTNEANGKFVDVTVNDRGPFSKKLEIDLTKKAFMEIASHKGHGTFKVKLEIIEDSKNI